MSIEQMFAELRDLLSRMEQGDRQTLVDEGLLESNPYYCRDDGVALPYMTDSPDTWGEALRELLKKAHEEDKDVYQEVWVPYMQELSYLWETALANVHSLDEMAYWCQVAPFASFVYLSSDIFEKPELSGFSENIQALSLQDDSDFEALAQCTSLPRLRRLDIPVGSYFSEEHARLLAGSKALGQVHTLLGADIEMDSGVVEELVKSESLRNLETLILAGDLSGDAIVSIAEAPDFGRFKRFYVGFDVDNEAIFALANSSNFSELELLDLRYCYVEAEGFKALFHSPHVTGLREIYTSGYLGVEAAQELVASKNLSQLEVLFLSGDHRGGHLSAEELKILATAKNLHKVHTLDLSGCDLEDEGVAVLVTSDAFPSLEKLDLSLCTLGNETAEAFALSNTLHKLKSLDLSNNEKIDASGAKALAESKSFSELEYLNLSSTSIDATGARVLIASGAFPKLKTLDLSYCDIAQEEETSLSSESFEVLL